MRTLWTTAGEPDPRLLRCITGARSDAVARAVVGGVPVLVTTAGSHEDAVCPAPDTHDCETAIVQVWPAAGGGPLRTVEGAGGRSLVTAVVHGRPVAVTSGPEDPTQVVDLESGAVRELADGGTDVEDLATAQLADGPAVVQVGWDETVRLLHLATGATRVLAAGDWLDAVAVLGTGDGTVVAAAERVRVGLWSVASGTRIRSLETPEPVRRLATWPGDDRLLAALDVRDDVHVWDVVTGERRGLGLRAGRHAHDLAAVRAAGGARLLALSDLEAVHVWDADADRPAGPPLVGPTGWCALVAGGPGVLVAASSTDETVGVWRVGDDEPATGHGHPSTLTCLAVTPDGYVVGGGTDGTVGSWRLADGVRGPGLGVLPPPVKAVAAVAAGGSVAVLAGGGDLNGTKDHGFHRWLDGGPDRPVAVDHRGQVDHLVTAVVGDRPVVVTSGAGPSVSVTDLVTGERVAELSGTEQPDGLATGRLAGRPVLAVSRWPAGLELWDLAERRPVAAAVDLEPGERVHGLVAVGDGPAVVTSADGVLVRPLAGGAGRRLVPDDGPAVECVAVRDGVAPLAAVARSDGTVSVVEVATGDAVGEVRLPYPATALCWAPDGDLLVACRRDVLRLRT